jgi:hypothetical protein
VRRLAARRGLIALALAAGGAAAAPDSQWQCAPTGARAPVPALAAAAGEYLDRIEALYPHQVLGLVRAGTRFYLLNASDIEWGERARLRLLALRLNESYLAAERRSVGAAPGLPPPGPFICLAPARASRAGLARTPLGDVVLAAGQRLHLVDPQEPHIAVEVRAAEDRSLELSEIFHRSARTGIYAGLTGPMRGQARHARGTGASERPGGMLVFRMASAGGSVLETRVDAPEAGRDDVEAHLAVASRVAPAIVAAAPQPRTDPEIAGRQNDSLRAEATVVPELPVRVAVALPERRPTIETPREEAAARPRGTEPTALSPAVIAVAGPIDAAAPQRPVQPASLSETLPARAPAQSAATAPTPIEGGQTYEEYAKIMKTMMALRRSGGVRSVSEMTYVHPAVEVIRRRVP